MMLIYMKIFRLGDVRKRVELRENISGSIALSKVRFVFKNFNINTEQKIIFLSQSNRPRRGVLEKINVLTELDILFQKHFNEITRGLDDIEKINSIFNELFHSNKLNITNENVLEIFGNINEYITKHTESEVTISPGFYTLSSLQKLVGTKFTFNKNTGKVTIKGPNIIRPSSSRSLESHGELYNIISQANILGRYGIINIHLRELDSQYLIEVPEKYGSPILYNMEMEMDEGRFFGEIMQKELTRLDFIPLRGEINELNVSFTDCEGNSIEINSEVSVELLVDI